MITLGGNPIKIASSLPAVGSTAPAFNLIDQDLSLIQSSDFQGKRVILNIFPSVDTGVCAQSARKFNEEASSLENTVVACVSRDLPFAMKRFCGAEGLENVVMLSDFKDGSFGNAMGVTMEDGAFAGLHSRAVVILDETGKVTYTEQVLEIGQEPNYSAALATL